MAPTMKIIACVKARPTGTGKIRKNNPYKAAGLRATLEVAIPGFTGGVILDHCRKLPAAPGWRHSTTFAHTTCVIRQTTVKG